ncbi:MAG: hypothetical protein M1817_000623 [Caeruleum heppii]|nr:MAG: hypothetical protein M1817_000623 [Caeruleum heppii]
MSSQPPHRTFSFQQHDDDNSFQQNPQPQLHPSARPSPSLQQPSSRSRQPPAYDTSGTYPDTVNPLPVPSHHAHPLSHPSSSFYDLQADRDTSSRNPAHRMPRHSDPSDSPPNPDPFATPPYDRSASRSNLPLPTESSDSDTPVPPPHASERSGPAINPPHEDEGRSWGRPLGYSLSGRTASSPTPGMDNLGESAAGGGIAGIALGVASHNERDSGIEALRGFHDGAAAPRRPPISQAPYSESTDRGFPSDDYDDHGTREPGGGRPMYQQNSFSSAIPLGGAAIPPAVATPGHDPSDISLHSYPSQDRFGTDHGNHYADNPYNQYSTTWDPRVAQTGLSVMDPNDIEDDGDDGFGSNGAKRRSVLSLGRQSAHGMLPTTAAPVAAAGAGGGMLGALGGLLGKRTHPGDGMDQRANGQYGPVPGAAYPGPGGSGPNEEKSEWLSRQSSGNKRLRIIVGILAAILIIAAIVGGIVGGVIGSRNAGSGASAGMSAKEDDGNGDLSKDSSEIKQLMNNPDLHKVFPGMDYTPFNSQYPFCLNDPPSQNNVTRDIAVLSQLTNKVRLYGTDCNQTEMVLHAIDRLGLTDMKVWLGAWLGNNATTNTRQLDQMNKLLDENDAARFAGVIVGNEVLYREDLTAEELGQVLADVRSNLKAKNIDLPVATSDLGDDWTPQLASEVDIVMANVHPFFAGITAEEATDWTYNFWEQKDVAMTLTLPNKPRNIISEVGWPSEGGNNCGQGTCVSDTDGSVASIEQMNIFMDKFICPSLEKGTEFFWFEAFDEPWKVQFNEPGKEWEDKWGLMDPARVLKPGIKIPDCGGRTAP